MLKNPKAERLLQEISVAYNDPAVAADKALAAKLLACAQELAKHENYLLTATRVNAVALSGIRQHMHQPIKSLNTLYQQTARTSEYYWGVAAAAFLSPLW
ncbi:bacteriocin immunity protein [Lactiplantibacillus sp. WILCCON 0030]|uniref:Bacteriocin immunity protein n=1 Tax=Lactiplantibacillus brownii TaxID=3069269 RepID=A0ABU1A8F2_9LACO|nr:bacteriocin immunity protein [Lactiplantibacillus brownii]MDQ7937210.1 bacteriocin immunity protein [Lactiplantibacillus brownii]